MDSLLITLDGPAGSGKSSVARRLAKRLGLEFLDTGAMYRGLAAACLDQGIDPATNHDAVVAIARHAHIRFDWSIDPPRLHIVASRAIAGGSLPGGGDSQGPIGGDVTPRLRDADVTRAVSDVASMPEVRQVMVEAQRRIGEHHPRLVTEGRDQGSVVFPQAQVKFYLDADPAVRARRRAAEIRAAGRPADEEEIRQQIIRRDDRDKSRADGPLICPVDAMRVDTSDMTLDQVLDHLERMVRVRLGATLDAGLKVAGTRGGGT